MQDLQNSMPKQMMQYTCMAHPVLWMEALLDHAIHVLHGGMHAGQAPRKVISSRLIGSSLYLTPQIPDDKKCLQRQRGSMAMHDTHPHV